MCFKTPDDAMKAKMALNNSTFNGKQLYVNHYEIKEVRKQQQESARDLADFNKYKQQQVQSNPADLLRNPEMVAMLSQLINMMPKLQNQGGYNNRGGFGGGQQRGGY